MNVSRRPDLQLGRQLGYPSVRLTLIEDELQRYDILDLLAIATRLPTAAGTKARNITLDNLFLI